jgi:DNA-binding response OmpR family regulator
MDRPNFKKFLVVDSFQEMRVLIVRTLLRVFPGAEITETYDSEEALQLARCGSYDAIIVHRAIGTDAATLVRLIRQDQSTDPILAVSSVDRSQELISAGATAFLNFEEWLRLGTVVGELLDDVSPLERRRHKRAKTER